MNTIGKLLIGGLLAFAFAVVAVESAHADDPGIPDTISIDTVYVPYNPGGGSADVQIAFITDDTVGTVQLPLTWHSVDGMIYPEDANWNTVFNGWYFVYDSVLFNPNLIRIIAAGAGFFITHGRVLIAITVHFNILPGASPQIVPIDTTIDPLMGHTLFSDRWGQIEWIPIIRPGFIRYGSKLSIDDDRVGANNIVLNANYPNPFNAQTDIEYNLPEDSPVRLCVYNIRGQLVSTPVDENQPAGIHRVTFDAQDLPSGVYLYKLQAGNYGDTRKMILIK